MKRKYVCAIISMLIVLLITGCWDSKDVDNRMIVGAIGIEQAEADHQKVKVWFRFPIPKTPGNNSKGKDFFSTSQVGETVVEATNLLRFRLPKALDLSSTRAFLIKDTIAETGLRKYLEFSIRERSVPLDTVIALVSGKMEKIFSSANPTGELSGIYTKLFFEPYAGGIPRKNKVTLWEVYAKLLNPMQSNLIPLLKETEHNMFSLVGNAYFSGERMMGVLSPDESLLYEIINERIGEAEIELTEKADMKILKNHTKMKVGLKSDGKPLIQIQSGITVTLIDSSQDEKLNSTQTEQYLEKMLTVQAQSLFEKTQKSKSDIFGFGNRYRSILQQHQYKQWPEMYKNADIRFRIKVHLRNTGLEFLK